MEIALIAVICRGCYVICENLANRQFSLYKIVRACLMEPKHQTTSAEVDDVGENAGAVEQGGTHLFDRTNPENMVDCKKPFRNSSKLLTKQASMFQICGLFGTFIGSHTHSTIHTIIASGDLALVRPDEITSVSLGRGGRDCKIRARFGKVCPRPPLASCWGKQFSVPFSIIWPQNLPCSILQPRNYGGDSCS